MADFVPVTPHIRRLDLRCFVVVPTAAWLVEHGGRFTLIDAGPRSQRRKLLGALLRALGGRGFEGRASDGRAPPDRVPDDRTPAGSVLDARALDARAPEGIPTAGRALGDRLLEKIILTHGHEDHAGGLSPLLAEPAFRGTPVWAHPLETPFVSGERRYSAIESSAWGYRFSRPMLNWKLSNPVARELAEGEAFDDLRVVHAPGHTPGQIALLHTADRALICGDACMTWSIRTLFDRRPRLGPPAAFATPDPKQAMATLRRLASLDFDLLLPSHGAPIERGKLVGWLAGKV